MDTETRSLRGVRVFVIVGLITLALGIAVVSGAVLRGVPGVVGALLPLILFLGFMWMILGTAFGGSPRNLLGSAGRAARGAAAQGTRAAARGVAGGVRGGARGGARMSWSATGLSTTMTVRRFRVRAMTGEIVPCLLLGDLIGDEVRHGDYVLLRGRRNRDGNMTLSYVDVLETPSGPTLTVVRTRRGFANRIAVLLDRSALVLAGLLAVVVVVEVTRLLW